MFSLADASGQRTASVAFRNCLYLIPLGFLAHDCKSRDFRPKLIMIIIIVSGIVPCCKFFLNIFSLLL